MIASRNLFFLGIILAAGLSPAASLFDDDGPPGEIRWRDAAELAIEGRGWSDTKAPYDRLPARAEGLVRPEVWNLSRHAAGLGIRFCTDARSIAVRWTLRPGRLAMPHMPATGVSGVDLYARRDGRWHFLAVGQPTRSPLAEATLIEGLDGRETEYRLNLPLYNAVSRVEIGLPVDASFRAAPPVDRGAKPIVFYGTSITQGGCASRPGMSYPAILNRKLGVPTVNLGFSGNGRIEPEVAGLLAELDPVAFVLDCLPNNTAAEVADRLPRFLDILRARHPDTPILLVETPGFPDAGFVSRRSVRQSETNGQLKRIFDERTAAGDRALIYVPAGDLLGTDGEATVDGVHPTDLGFLRIADALEPHLRRVLKSEDGANQGATCSSRRILTDSSTIISPAPGSRKLCRPVQV